MRRAFHRETAQGFAFMVPSVEMPIVTVIREALRGYGAFGLLIAAAAVVGDVEPFALQHRAGN